MYRVFRYSVREMYKSSYKSMIPSKVSSAIRNGDKGPKGIKHIEVVSNFAFLRVFGRPVFLLCSRRKLYQRKGRAGVCRDISRCSMNVCSPPCERTLGPVAAVDANGQLQTFKPGDSVGQQ